MQCIFRIFFSIFFSGTHASDAKTDVSVSSNCCPDKRGWPQGMCKWKHLATVILPATVTVLGFFLGNLYLFTTMFLVSAVIASDILSPLIFTTTLRRRTYGSVVMLRVGYFHPGCGRAWQPFRRVVNKTCSWKDTGNENPGWLCVGVRA